jgi:hypothetical protein
MKKSIKTMFAIVAFTMISTIGMAQYKMDSNGRTISNSNGSTVGKIDSDGKNSK